MIMTRERESINKLQNDLKYINICLTDSSGFILEKFSSSEWKRLKNDEFITYGSIPISFENYLEIKRWMIDRKD
jgi:hypothetical protein